MTISIDPRVFGSPLLTWPGLTIGVGVAVMIAILMLKAGSVGTTRTQVYNMASVAVAGGIIAARLGHVLDYAGYYAEVPFQIAYVWNGGFAVWGGLLGSMGAIAWRIGREIAAPHRLWSMLLPLGLALLGIFRAVDFLTGQRPGRETALPWGVIYRNPNADAFLLGAYQHPVALYEMLLIVVIATVVVLLARRQSWTVRLLPTTVLHDVTIRVHVALGLYAIGRFVIGFATVGEVHVGLLQSQWIAVAVLAGTGAVLVRSRREHARAKATTAEKAPAGAH